jgi:hypothetical protein
MTNIELALGFAVLVMYWGVYQRDDGDDDGDEF